MAKTAQKASVATTSASDKYILRLPDGMRDYIAGMAARNGRTMNAEIISALARYIADDGAREATTAEVLSQRIQVMSKQIDEIANLVKQRQKK